MARRDQGSAFRQAGRSAPSIARSPGRRPLTAVTRALRRAAPTSSQLICRSAGREMFAGVPPRTDTSYRSVPISGLQMRALVYGADGPFIGHLVVSTLRGRGAEVIEPADELELLALVREGRPALVVVQTGAVSATLALARRIKDV